MFYGEYWGPASSLCVVWDLFEGTGVFTSFINFLCRTFCFKHLITDCRNLLMKSVDRCQCKQSLATITLHMSKITFCMC